MRRYFGDDDIKFFQILCTVTSIAVLAIFVLF